MTSRKPRQHTWGDEAQDLMRGVGGATIVGIPLVYTMEMWQHASLAHPRTVLLLMVLAVLINIGYNYVSGFRRGGGLKDAVCHAIESYGLGALLALVLLVLLRIVDASTPPIDVACKIALEAIPLSIGVSVANTQFAASGGIGSDNNGHEQPGHPVLTEAGLTVAGAIVFAGNVAPTEEIMLLATRATAAHLLALIAFSLLLSYGLIFVAEFSGLQARRGAKGLLQSPWGETLLAYALSLLVTLGLLYAFHDVSLAESPYTTAAALVVLGLPAVVGGAAGRLLVGGAQQQA